MIQRAAAAILAGGRSRRMGADKALLPLDGEPLLGHVIARLRPLVSEILIIGDNAGAYRRFGIPVVPDPRPDQGPLAAIRTALLSTAAPAVFCCACDMPFLEAALVDHLLGLVAPGVAAVVPRVRGEPEPLCAVYTPAALPGIDAETAGGGRQIRGALARVSTRYVDESELRACDPELRSFVNLNTPEDLARAIRRRR
jgi:molybdenum cofactor guanylyltransferase